MKKDKLVALLEMMTLEEKFAQVSQLTGEHYVDDFAEELVETGPTFDMLNINEAQLYSVGSLLGVSGCKATNAIQEKYLAKSRLKIPLLFMHDAIHGYKTIFPIPLALASSFNDSLLEQVGKETARELRLDGIHVNFSPMADLSRDGRWGRIMESFGEDPILSGNLGSAMIRGYQQIKEGKIGYEGVAATLKHFAAYGASLDGKDYASVDMSERELLSQFGKPYELALKAEPRFVMSSFNSLNGEPVTGSKKILTDLLREHYGFKGLLISDWGAVKELLKHKVVPDEKEAATLTLKAGMDIEMVSTTFMNYGSEIIQTNPELEHHLDQAVLKILSLKNELGLFENPYVNDEVEDILVTPKTRKYAREIAHESIILLKNDEQLPLGHEKIKSMVIIGPMAETNELLGNWMCKGRFDQTVSLKAGFTNQFTDMKVTTFESLSTAAIKAIEVSDYTILALGEHWELSGEGHSSANIELSQDQTQIIQDVRAMTDNFTVLIFTGRPLALGHVIEDIPALLWCWYPGTEAGNAITDILFGIENPSGKLPISLPRINGQGAIHYNEYPSGRPANDSSYSSRYQDVEIGPLFAFGSGLSYTNLTYSDFKLSKNKLVGPTDSLKLEFTISNKSSSSAKETIILYLEDIVSKSVRPLIELIKYQKVNVLGKSQESVSFEITSSDLAYWNSDLEFVIEEGEFNLYINDSQKVVQTISYQEKE